MFSFLLTFAYAEAQEAKKDYVDVHATYEHLLETLRGELERIEQETGEGKTATANNGSNGNGSGLTPANTPFDGANSGLGGGVNSASSSFNTQTTKPSTPAQSELAERRAEYGLAYIVYMRFGRRAEGIKASRAIFGKARRDRWSPWQVYEAAGTSLSLTYHQNIESFIFIALMEYHCSDDKTVASRIFEKGLDLFGDEIDFVLRYLGFLISINDANSELNICHEKIFNVDNIAIDARALFERVIGSFSPDTARPLWERWARYEYQYGDLEAAQKLEKRMAEVYPQGQSIPL